VIPVVALLCLVPGPAEAQREWFPRWSPDGTRIAFVSERDGDPEIYLMNPNGTGRVRLTHAAGRDAHPLPPDGRRLVFQSPRANGEDTNLYVMDTSGADLRQLTRLRGFAGVPVYSPDGRAIAFQWRETNDFEDGTRWRICVMRDDGTGLRVITPGAANDQVPSWSGDGSRLLFYSDRTGRDQLYTMRPDGEDLRQWAERHQRRHAWSPDDAASSSCPTATARATST
jgi:TolB protein